MPKFGRRSSINLATCHISLQFLFLEVIKKYDCTILEGHRGRIAQDRAYHSGYSKIKWPDGNHNKEPSLAVDAVPYPIDWKDKERMCHFAGYVLGIASKRGISIRWGGDWDGDKQFGDQAFYDLPHFELILDG